MKVTPRFTIRAALVVTAAGVIGAFGACKSDKTVGPPPPPPPPPPGVAAPSGLTATAVGTTGINLAWTDNATNETGFRVDRCSGAGCTTFAQVGTNLAANAAAFSDTGLTASTSYSYRVRAFNATDSSSWTPTATATTGVVTGSPSFTMIGAGEITTCASSAGPVGTAAIVKGTLDADTSAIAFTVGNNLADMGAGTTFQNCFDPKWGAFKSRTYYSIGNADFGTDRGPDGVYGYLGTGTAAGALEVAHKGWFSFDKGSWHIVVLNTSDWEHGGAATFGIDAALHPTPSEQVDWLTTDLQNNQKPCIAVISWERRFYTSSTSTLGRNSNMRPMAGIMQQYGVDLVISAKDKAYERFAPMDYDNGTANPAGFRQFIVGTGGRSWDGVVSGTAPATRESYIPQAWGVLKLTMNENSYDWQFINTVSGGPTDSGTAQCH